MTFPTDNGASASEPALRFIGSGTPMRDMVRGFDWSTTALGPISGWSRTLKTAAGIVMNSAHPMFLWWGPQLVQLYNDAYVPCFGKGKHPAALGQTGAACWPEIWPIIWPQIEAVLNGAAASWYENKLVPIWRNGRVEEVYWTYTYTPVYDDRGAVPGVLVVCTETTAHVLTERRRRTLDLLSQQLLHCDTVDDIWRQVLAVAAANPGDIRSIRREQPEPEPGTGSAEAGAGRQQVTIYAAELNLGLDLALTFGISAQLPFNRPYRQFLEQFSAIVCAAFLRHESDLALAITTAERDRLLLDAPVGAAILTGAELVYQLANPLYCQIIGRPAEQVQGLPFAEVLPELDGSPVHRIFQAVYRDGTPYVSAETMVRLRLNGGAPQERYYSYNLAPLRHLDGSVYGLMVIAIDITHQVLARNEIERLNHDLHLSARAKDEFLAMLGHELRNPLAPIVTALELMKLRGADTCHEQAVIQRQVSHLMRLVDDLLDVSRITRGKVELRKETVDLRDVLHKALEMTGHLVEQRKHRLTARIPSIRWFGDPARLAQIVANLLTNAARYTPRQGDIALDMWQQDGRILIQVKDNGIGVPATMLPRIFDLFVQGERNVDRAEGGLGIGLALVRNLVQMHDGQVSAHSDGKDCGSTFTVSLPAAAPAAAPHDSAGETPPAAGAGRHGKRFLVVDDNQDAADSLAELLRALGHDGSAVYTPQQALLAIDGAASGFGFDFIVLDIGLPGMDGYELARRLRQTAQGRHARLIALSGYGQAHDRQRSLAAGFAAHLVKPVDIAELQKIL